MGGRAVGLGFDVWLICQREVYGSGLRVWFTCQVYVSGLRVGFMGHFYRCCLRVKCSCQVRFMVYGPVNSTLSG